MLSLRVLTMAAFAASIVACSTEVTSVGVGGTISLAETSRSSPAAGLATVEVGEIVIETHSGKALARGGSPLLCYDPFDFELDASGDTTFGNLEVRASLGLRAEGIAVESGRSGGSDGAAYVLRGRIEGVDLTWCQLSFGIVDVDGEQSTYWELFSLLDQKVVYSATIATEISIREAQPIDFLLVRALELAVEQSARNLARARGFRKVLAEATTAGTASQDDAPIVIARLPPATGTFQANSVKIQAATVVLARKGHGSGFFISQDGYLLTNAHVVGGANQIRVTLQSGEEIIGQVVRKDSRRDVALVKIAVPSGAGLCLSSVRTSSPSVRPWTGT
jgi:hypothetical protein